MSVPAHRTKPMHDVAETADPVTIDDLETLYRFRDRKLVRSYLTRHPFLVAGVADAAEVIPRFLPGELELEVVVGVDEDEEDGDLFAIVVTDRTPEEMRPLLDKLLHEWLIPSAERFDARFNVGLGFRRQG